MNGPEDFWGAVDRSGGTDACWPWSLSTTSKRGNYGQVKWQGSVQRAHRVAYELAVGPIPSGLTLDHTCHDPDICVEPCPHTRCCNPEHLEPVTRGENSHRRARQACGAGHPKTSEHGHARGTKWRCVTCETNKQRERRARMRSVA